MVVLYLLPALLLVVVRVIALALFVRLAIGLFGSLLVYRVLAERERDWSAVIDRWAEVDCTLLRERFAAPAAVIELLLRAADEFALVTLAGRSLFDAVLEPAAVGPALVPDRLLPLVRLALFAFVGSMPLAPYFV